MTPVSPTAQTRRRLKARIVGFSLIDVVVDVVAPLLISIALTTAGVPTLLALTVGGIAVGAKTALGRIDGWSADRRAAFVGATAAASLAVLIVLATVGASYGVAAAVSGAIGVVPVTVGLLRRRIDGFGLLILVEITASAVVTLISEDPRLVLARPAVYTAIAGVYAIITCLVGRPLMLDATKPMATAGDPVRAAGFENAWKNSPTFRTVERTMTLGIGLVLIAEAVLRVVVVYGSARPNVAVTGLTAQIPAIALFAVWFLFVRLLGVPRARAAVDQETDRLRADDHCQNATQETGTTGSRTTSR